MGALTLDLDGGSETLRLSTIEVYNWGPFNRYHRARFDPDGTAIVGPTGSGKTTLVDALMTLLVAHPRYNLASTGGHDSDRDIESYVRGVLGQGTTTDQSAHISRPGKVVTGLAATFSRSGRAVTLAAVLWVDTTSRSASDIKKRWLVSESDDESLETWLTVHSEGGDRALKKHCEFTPRLDIWESKTKYLARVRRVFDITENAFALLNRASGLKQLDSIDAIFRDLVLDDHSLFDSAAKAADNFNQLVEIRAELETARTQHQALVPLRKLSERHAGVESELQLVRRLQAVIDIWYALAAQRLWAERRAELEARAAELEETRSKKQAERERLEQVRDRLRAEYDQVGGTEIDSLDSELETLESLLASQQRRLDEVTATAAQLDITIGRLTPARLAEVQEEAARLRSRFAGDSPEAERQFERAAADLVTNDDDLGAARAELKEVESRPHSNIDPRYDRFRSELAAAVNTDEADLPFVAELVEVRPDERRWRGAIERAIGGHRLRVLVDEDLLPAALRWVNNRDNKLHVRLERAAGTPRPHRDPHHDSFIHKLNIKSHRHQPALISLLVSIDRHCLEHPEQLASAEHAMTPEGLLSGRSGRYEKPDQHRLKQNWMTGFDNHARLTALKAQISELARAGPALRTALNGRRDERDALQRRIADADALAGLSYDEIDIETPEQRQADLQRRKERLTDPGSDLAIARDQWESACRDVKAAKKDEHETIEEIGATGRDFQQATERETAARKRAGDGLGEDDHDLAAQHLALADDPETVTDQQQNESKRLQEEAKDKQAELGDVEGELRVQMGKAKSVDTGELVDAGTTMADLDDYLERLRVLEDEALPERQARFITYLNQSSDEGVSSVLAGVDSEVDQIEARIADLNRTLRRVDFEPGRCLELRPRRVTQPKLVELNQAQKRLAAARLNDETGEAHYAALTNVINHLRSACDAKHTLWARSILDPRHRLTFMVAVVDRETGQVTEERTSSEGGSGGEKEIIASYVLTASLAYALCPDGAAQPLFGTVVLDEAFSKSSETVAARIVDALGVFGLHPLFVTPNKELRLLRANTRSAILVNKTGKEARLLDMSWTELDQARPASLAPGRVIATDPAG